jgi:hypothetical protein
MLLVVHSSAQSDSLFFQKQPNAENILTARLQVIQGEKQYITADAINLHGIARLSELISLIQKAFFTTINGEKYYLNINATSTTQQQNFLLMVNGRRMELERWDAIALDLLGIPIDKIAYVEITNTPQLINGNFAGFGAMNIVLRTDFSGLHYSVYTNFGNYINDPGSAKHIPGQSTPNIDKNGLVYAHNLGYYHKNGYLNASFNYQDHFARDSSISNTRYSYLGNLNKTASIAPRLNGAWQFKNLFLEAGVAYNSQKSFIYRPALQQETPNNISYSEYTLGITKRITTTRYYKINFSSNTTDVLSRVSQFNSYTYQHTNGNMETGLSLKRVNAIFGYTFNYASLYNTAYQLQHNGYTQLNYTLSKNTTQQISANFNWLDNSLNPQIVFKHRKYKNAISSWSAVLSYQQQQSNHFFNQYWFVRNNSLLAPTSNLSNNPYQVVTADYFHQLNMGESIRININPGFRYHHNYQFIQPVGINNTSGTDMINYTNNNSNFYSLTFGVNMHYQVFKSFWFDIDYFAARNNGDGQIDNLLQNDARRKLLITLYAQLPGRIEIASRILAYGSSHWQYYNTSNVLVTEEMNGFVNLDVSANKKMWDERLNINFSLRNLLDAPVVYHPMGATLTLAMFLTIQFRLHNIHYPFKKK